MSSVISALVLAFCGWGALGAMWQGKNFEELSYIEFYTIFSAARDKVAVFNNHQLDHLIWYAYKNDSIRSEVAKALAQVL